MLIFPAIDILSGQCVRLKKGEYSTAHKVAEDPIDTAKSFSDCGAEWIHMVDLDGAKQKSPVNTEVFVKVARETNLKVELGGGIRTLDDIKFYIENGIQRVILGSVAVSDPDLVAKAVDMYSSEHIVVGIDAKEDDVATNGWLQSGKITYTDLALKMQELGVEYLIYTDISRDGMLSGPSFERLFALNEAVKCNITASGGVSCLDDIKKLKSGGIYAAIAGKALYTGDLDLKTALQEAHK